MKREFTTGKVITTEMIKGIKINDTAALRAAGLDLKKVTTNGTAAMMKQIFMDGFFHADPHPGNILVLENNVIGFLDFGIVGVLEEERKEELADLLLAIMQKNTKKITGIFISMGIIEEGVDIRSLGADIGELISEYYDMPLRSIRLRNLVEDFTCLIRKYRIRVPSDYAMLAKTLATIEGIGVELDPEFDMVTRLKPFAQELLKSKISPERFVKDLASAAGDFGTLAKIFPEEMIQIIRKLRTGKLRMEFEHLGLINFMYTLDILVNRISVSLIIAALIVGSSLIIQTNRGHLLLGVPTLGVIGLAVAFILGLLLLVSILKDKEPSGH